MTVLEVCFVEEVETVIFWLIDSYSGQDQYQQGSPGPSSYSNAQSGDQRQAYT